MLKPDTFEFYNKVMPKVTTDNVNLFYFYDNSSGNMNLHNHDLIEIIFVLNGDVSIYSQNVLHKINNGSIIIIPNNLYHCTVINNKNKVYERFVIHISLEYIEKIITQHHIDNKLLFLEEPYIIDCSPENIWKIRSILDGIYSSFNKRDNLGKALLHCSTTELIITFYTMLQNDNYSKTQQHTPVVSSVIQYIDQNFTNPLLSIDEITDYACLSTGYLSRIFKKYTGTSIYNFIIYKRLEHFKNLVRQGQPILESCMMSGFKEYSSFLKSFKQAFNMTPREYLKSIDSVV